MDLTALGASIFAAIPAGMKGTVTFRRRVPGVSDPVTGTIAGTSFTSWVAECVYTAPRGTQSESFAEQVAVRSKYVRLIVKAAGTPAPLAGDEAILTGGESLTVVGLNPTDPDGVHAAIYTVDCERVS